MSAIYETVHHATALSNFARAFDKYSRGYDKARVPESRFPDRFFVLREDELAIGLEKTQGLLDRTKLPGDRILILRGDIASAELQPNRQTGKGRYVMGTRFPVQELFLAAPDGALEPVSAEDAYAMSLRILNPSLQPYDILVPRTLSVLPIALACQAACRFCFSKSSVSIEQVPHSLDLGRLDALCRRARRAGAERFVITGGGEPGLVPHDQLVALITAARRHFPKVVLITNGIHLARRSEEERHQRLRDYAAAGLSVLALSRHHHDAAANAAIMGLDTRTERVIQSWVEHRAAWPTLALRLICVLQTDGIADAVGLAAYADWASGAGVEEICFKELYVSTLHESAYHAASGNTWSLDHQVPLALVTSFFPAAGFEVAARLPWGAPVFSGMWKGRKLRVAAYTEPSLFWERSHGIARSWNLMADGTCLVSLEDPGSVLPDTVELPA